MGKIVYLGTVCLLPFLVFYLAALEKISRQKRVTLYDGFFVLSAFVRCGWAFLKLIIREVVSCFSDLTKGVRSPRNSFL